MVTVSVEFLYSLLSIMSAWVFSGYFGFLPYPKAHSSDVNWCVYITPVWMSVSVGVKRSVPEGDPAQQGSYPVLKAARRGSGHWNSELESVGWKRIILLVLIHLS